MATASGVSTGPVLPLPSLRPRRSAVSPVPSKSLLPRRTVDAGAAGSYFAGREVYNRKGYHQSLSLKKIEGLQAAVLPLTPPILDDEERRKQMCEDYGFTQIGEHLPDNITLKYVMDTLPKEVFEINDVKAWTSVLISVTSYALALFFIAKAPWYLIPLAWAWTGTAVTGFFLSLVMIAPTNHFQGINWWKIFLEL